MLKRGRRQSNPVYNHFKFDDITSTSICIHCEKSIPETYSTNLLAHMKIYHPEITIQEENEKECATTAKKSEILQTSIKNYGYSTDRISIAISKDKVLNSIIELCTINLCPFSIVEYSGFKTIIDPICDAFKLTINRKTLSTYIIERANNMRNDLSEKLSELKCFIKADICTRLGRSVLGIKV